LPDSLYAARKGATDSELLFLLALAGMEQGESAAQAVVRVFDETVERLQVAGIGQPLRFAAALADGKTLYAFRLASDGQPPTLYLRHDSRGTVIASEPLDEGDDPWQQLPIGAVVTATQGHYCIEQAHELAQDYSPA
jgi:glutamine amidotransferase